MSTHTPTPTRDRFDDEISMKPPTRNTPAKYAAVLLGGAVALGLSTVYFRGRTHQHRSLSQRSMEARVFAQAAAVTVLSGLALYQIFVPKPEEK